MDEATRRIAAIIARDICGFSVLEFSRRYSESLPEPVVARREMMSGSDFMLANAFLWHPGIRALGGRASGNSVYGIRRPHSDGRRQA